MVDLPDFGTPLRSIAGRSRRLPVVRQTSPPKMSLTPAPAVVDSKDATGKGRSGSCLNFLCATLTVLPDYLYRRYVQESAGKRSLFSSWYELDEASRW
jgi:hypothetical protein